MSDTDTGGRVMRALIVEDSPVMRAIIVEYCVELGFEVYEAEGGREALRRLEEMPSVDVVLVDWHMPGMDGRQFIEAVRAMSRFATTPMMMVTTEIEPARIATALEAGANEYLMKPFDVAALLEKLLIMGVEPRRKAA